KKTIEEVAQFLGVSPKNKIKTLALVATETDAKTGKPRNRNVIVLLRGDHSLNEAKLAGELGTTEVRPMQEEEIQKLFGGPAGYLGPVGLAGFQEGLGTETMKIMLGDLPLILGDAALKERKNLISGANQEDYHLRNVTPGRDFSVSKWLDLRNVTEGEGCPKCGTPLKVAKAVEIGHIFKLGYKYSESMGARVLDKDGKEVTLIMGSYGIGIERILTSAIEQANDADGFALPPAIAPFDVVVTVTNAADEKLMAAGRQVAEELEKAGYDVLLDDRDERPGVKFKDADLVGIPFRINVGKKVSEGKVELVRRSTRETQDATIAAVTSELSRLLPRP
ncbi:MAG TPA: YbaK/EbsC family protein, partial [Terriglobales bacterium]|nr:YbaK/EbsC family protein [Terriglobales bacterium]